MTCRMNCWLTQVTLENDVQDGPLADPRTQVILENDVQDELLADPSHHRK